MHDLNSFIDEEYILKMQPKEKILAGLIAKFKP